MNNMNYIKTKFSNLRSIIVITFIKNLHYVVLVRGYLIRIYWSVLMLAIILSIYFKILIIN